MTTTAAAIANKQLIDRLNAAATVDELAAVLATIADIRPGDGRAPGFPTDSADGDYYNGHLFATFAAGRYAMTEMRHLNQSTLALWNELDQRNRAAAAEERDAARTARADRGRGRPEIGRRVEVRLPEWLIAIVEARADAEGVTRADVLRALVMAGHDATKNA